MQHMQHISAAMIIIAYVLPAMASLMLFVRDPFDLVGLSNELSVKESDMDLLTFHSNTFMAAVKVSQLGSVSTLNHNSTSFCFRCSGGRSSIYSS